MNPSATDSRFRLLTNTLIGITFALLSGQRMDAVAAQVQDSSNSRNRSQTTDLRLVDRIKQTADEKRKSLQSVKKIDEHPLYLMTYFGDYDCESPINAAGSDCSFR